MHKLCKQPLHKPTNRVVASAANTGHRGHTLSETGNLEVITTSTYTFVHDHDQSKHLNREFINAERSVFLQIT